MQNGGGLQYACSIDDAEFLQASQVYQVPVDQPVLHQLLAVQLGEPEARPRHLGDSNYSGDEKVGKMGEGKVGRMGEGKVGRMGEGKVRRMGEGKVGKMGEAKVGRRVRGR